MPDRRRKKGVYHVNLLKRWEEAGSVCGLAKEVSEEEFPDWKASGYVQPTLGSQVPMSDQDKGKTAFTTPKGLYVFISLT